MRQSFAQGAFAAILGHLPAAGAVMIAGLGWVASGCKDNQTTPAPSEPVAAAETKAGSQPGGPGSRASLPAGHTTSTVAVDLEAMFRLPDVEDDVVLTIGAHRRTKKDLEQTLRTMQIELTAVGIPGDLTREEVLLSAFERMAKSTRRRLLADELKVKVDEKDVKAWLHDLELRLDANEKFRVFLLRAGKDAESRRQDAIAAVSWRAVQDRLFKKVLVDNESVARAYYDKNRKQFTDHAGIATWRIFIRAPRGMVQRDRDIARSRAEKVHEQAVKQPERFEDLAINHSAGGKGPHGGFIGWTARGTLPKDIEDQIFAAKPNSILPLYEAPEGFYIYKIGKARKESVRKFDTVKADILRRMYPARVKARIKEELDRLKEKYPIKIHIAEVESLRQARVDKIEALRKKAMERGIPPPTQN